MIIITIALIVWIVIGVFYVKSHEEGWILMITDDRNVRNTWVALPALALCWILWPVKSLSYWIFITMNNRGW